jgi:protein TonB
MRGKNLEGAVTIIFVLDASGKVTNPRVEKSTHRAFEKPALDAVKQWKFEPGIQGGRRVPCNMRVPIRFPQPN